LLFGISASQGHILTNRDNLLQGIPNANLDNMPTAGTFEETFLNQIMTNKLTWYSLCFC